MKKDVTLQISLAPGDWRHAQHLLPHQLRQWSKQVGEVLLTLDLHRSSGRFSNGWEEGRERMKKLIQVCVRKYTDVRSVEIDYSKQARTKVAKTYFNKTSLPAKDFRGGPFYTYFYGLYASKSSRVLHLDSDMMFGGGSQQWISEAVELLENYPKVVTCSPLPGPPSSDGRLTTQEATEFTPRPDAFLFTTMSTRLFLVDKIKLRSRLCPLSLERPSLRSTIKAIVEGNPPYDLPENILSDAMRRHGLLRVDFLGSGTGMWSLHPPYRNERFYRKLPELIDRVEAGDVPPAQRGDYDINDSMVDWSNERAALRRNRWWKRIGRRIGDWCSARLRFIREEA